MPVFLDSDEVLENKESFKNKIDLLSQNQNVKNVITGGLKNPDGYPNINYYINTIGDPFSFFMYDIFSENFYKSIGEKYKNITRHENNIVVKLGDDEITPICDGGGHFFDLEFLKDNFDTSDVNIVPKIFYEMVGRTKNFAVFNNDFVVHYSTTSIKKYFKKIKWRIVNNIFYRNETAGFANREEVNKVFNIKKYLFIPYSLLLVPAILHSILLFLKHKNSILLLHFVFSFYTGILICYYYFLKILKIKPKLSLYGR